MNYYCQKHGINYQGSTECPLCQSSGTYQQRQQDAIWSGPSPEAAKHNEVVGLLREIIGLLKNLEKSND